MIRLGCSVIAAPIHAGSGSKSCDDGEQSVMSVNPFTRNREVRAPLVTRQAAGQTVPVAEGVVAKAPADSRQIRHPGRVAATVGVCWIVIVGVIIGIGELVTRYGNGNVLGDHTIPHWLAAHRSSSWSWWSALFSSLGSTIPIQLAIVATCIAFLVLYRRWRPVIFMVTLILGELFAFLITEYVVKRPRPDVHNMDAHLPTSAYPSGHVAATTCVYVGLAILVMGHARGWWRWLFVALAVAMPVCVIAARLYRGEHHPTDVLGSLVFAGLWLTTATLLIRPNSGYPTPRLPGRMRNKPEAI
jgi:undecaprenyl-diphosphatase